MSYHHEANSIRVQKRLAINRCFGTIRDQMSASGALTYVTFGGRHLLDVLDFVRVFRTCDYHIAVLSYEQDPQVASASACSCVAKELSRVASVELCILAHRFPGELHEIRRYRDRGPCIYFLDYTKVFARRQASDVTSIARKGLIRKGDFMMITSCISPRIVHQPRFLHRYSPLFRRYFGPKMITTDFRIRNHVDLFLNLSLQGVHVNGTARQGLLQAEVLAKYRYRDTMIGMGLWLFKIIDSRKGQTLLMDRCFREFPDAFVCSSVASHPKRGRVTGGRLASCSRRPTA